MTTTNFLDAYAQGWFHHERFGLRCECPFQQGSEQHYAWNKGYADHYRYEREKKEHTVIRTLTKEST